MDIRDNIHTQLVEHIATLRVIVKQETPAPAIWEEMQRYFDEVAAHLERNVLPRVDFKAPYLDLRGNGTTKVAELGAAKVAELVGITSAEAADEDRAALDPEETADIERRNGSLLERRR